MLFHQPTIHHIKSAFTLETPIQLLIIMLSLNKISSDVSNGSVVVSQMKMLTLFYYCHLCNETLFSNVVSQNARETSNFDDYLI